MVSKIIAMIVEIDLMFFIKKVFKNYFKSSNFLLISWNLDYWFL